MIVYEIPGDPIPLKRARYGKNRFYDSQAKQKKDIQLLIRSVSDGDIKHTEAIKVVIEYHMPIPKSWSRTKRLNAVDKPHVSTPDLSNLIKFVEDALNDVVWKDDSIIYELHCRKRYAERSMTRIYIEKHEEML